LQMSWLRKTAMDFTMKAFRPMMGRSGFFAAKAQENDSAGHAVSTVVLAPRPPVRNCRRKQVGFENYADMPTMRCAGFCGWTRQFHAGIPSVFQGEAALSTPQRIRKMAVAVCLNRP